MTRCVECGGPVDDDGCAIGDRDDALLTPEDAEAMVALLRRPYGNLTGGEKIALADAIEADRAEIERLTQERRMIVSHATMGGTDGVGLSLNDISVRITALRNELYNDGKARAEAAEARLTALEADRVKVAADTWAKAEKIAAGIAGNDKAFNADRRRGAGEVQAAIRAAAKTSYTPDARPDPMKVAETALQMARKECADRCEVWHRAAIGRVDRAEADGRIPTDFDEATASTAGSLAAEFRKPSAITPAAVLAQAEKDRG
jgi:hypothetical protein